MQSLRNRMDTQMSKRNEIVLSDEEDNEEGSNRNQKMGIRQTKAKGKSLVPTCEENDYSDSDDVCVVGEVSPFKKYPKGAVIGIHRPHEFTCTSSHIRRRRKPESSSGVRSITIRRSPVGSSFNSLRNSSTIRRKFFQMEESIRLDERRSYVELLKKLLGMSVILGAEAIRSCIFPGSVSRNLARHSLTWDPPREIFPKTKPNNLQKSSVEFVDLTCDDSDWDIVEVPQVSPASEHDNFEELPSGSGGDVMIDLEEDLENCGSSSASAQLEDTNCVPSSSTKQLEVLNVDDSDDHKNDEYINLEEEIEDGESKEEEKRDKRGSSGSACKRKPDKNLEDQMLHQMHLEDRSIKNAEPKIEDEELEESQPEITHEMQILVLKAFSNKSTKVLVDAFGLEIRPKDIHTLKGSKWLNDQIINFYMSLLMERGKLSSYPSVYCFNTFFYVKLLASGQSSLKRWTRKVDIFSYDLLLVPIHLKVHWCLACINCIEKRIEYYDSMGGENEECGKALLKYLEDEHLEKKNEYLNVSGWEIVTMKDIPEQLNGSDCGVFLCTYAEYICRLAKLTFTQRDMPYFRVKMAYEILTSKLLL